MRRYIFVVSAVMVLCADVVLQLALGNDIYVVPSIKPNNEVQKLSQTAIHKATIRLAANNDHLFAEERSPAQLSLVLHRRSKALGAVKNVEVGKLWLERDELQLQWTDAEYAKEGVAELQYSAIRLQTLDKEIIAIYQFIQPEKLSLKLRGIESLKLAADPVVFEKLKLEISGLPDGWEQSLAKDGRKIELKHGSAKIAWEFADQGNELHSQTIGLAKVAVPDPKQRLAAVNRQLTMDEENLRRRQTALSQVRNVYRRGRSTDSTRERASIEASITIVEAKIARLRELQEKLTLEVEGAADAPPSPANDIPRGATLRVTLPNGVCVAEVELGAESAPANIDPPNQAK